MNSCAIAVAAALSAVTPGARASSLAEHLSPAEAVVLKELVDRAPLPFAGRDPHAEEVEYQSLAGRQTLADLALVYAPENRDRVKVAYPAFTAMDGKPAMDLGYGLHVVKRLELPREDGLVKVVDVNEHWAENPDDGGLFAPDEIRVKTLVFPGTRRVPGSHRQYLFDRIRLAFDRDGAVTLHRQTRFEPRRRSDKIHYRQMRASVSAPFSCDGCHRPGPAFTRISDLLLAPGEERNHEAVVQDRYFARAMPDMDGFGGYLSHLEETGRDASFVARVRAALLEPGTSFALPALRDALAGPVAPAWLPADETIDEEAPERRQGRYRRRGRWYLDAIETVVPGKYESWAPASVIPGRLVPARVATHLRR